MISSRLIILPCILLGMVPAIAADDNDARELVTMPGPMQKHMLTNMRDHLAVLAEAQKALGEGAFDRAADVVEKRLGMSSLKSHGASHMAPFMPKPMQEIGTQMHKAASQFSLIAQESAVDGDVKRPLQALHKVTQQCMACHAAYRTH
jgi:hypothetical protein